MMMHQVSTEAEIFFSGRSGKTSTASSVSSFINRQGNILLNRRGAGDTDALKWLQKSERDGYYHVQQYIWICKSRFAWLMVELC